MAALQNVIHTAILYMRTSAVLVMFYENILPFKMLDYKFRTEFIASLDI
jgi:hypothetical protein